MDMNSSEIESVNTIEITDYIDIKSYNMNIIPDNISISTMSITCKLGTIFSINNIYDNMDLEDNYIVAIKSSKGMRCSSQFTPKFKSTNKNSKRNFFNQLTIIMSLDSIEDKYMNIKLFKNGSIQMTGCKKLEDANLSINKLIKKLSEKDIYVENIDDLKVSNFKVDLINSNFGVNYLINREQLYTILIENNVLCRFSNIHACVNIKYEVLPNSKNYVSIFVFQTGNIIITGAKNSQDIKDAYTYIVTLMNQNKSKIMKKDILSILTLEEIKELIVL